MSEHARGINDCHGHPTFEGERFFAQVALLVKRIETVATMLTFLPGTCK
jgi:hypothetical protein